MDWLTDVLRSLERFSEIPLYLIGETTVAVGTVSRAPNEQGIEMPFSQRGPHLKNGSLELRQVPCN